MSKVTFLSARYLGRHPELQKGRDERREGRLHVTSEWVGLLLPDGNWNEEACVPFYSVASVEVVGGRVMKSAGGIALSVLGGVAFNDLKTDRTMLVLRLKSGDSAYFEVDEQRPASLRVAIEPMLMAARVPYVEDADQPSDAEDARGVDADSIADELTKLAKLKESGHLSDEEFAKLKARLIG